MEEREGETDGWARGWVGEERREKKTEERKKRGGGGGERFFSISRLLNLSRRSQEGEEREEQGGDASSLERERVWADAGSVGIIIIILFFSLSLSLFLQGSIFHASLLFKLCMKSF